jgi:deoxyribodipyrimidine photo-lyase
MPQAIHLFRRDLRLEDNIALHAALSKYEVLPVFILNPKQITSNEYKSDNAIQFMVASLHELDAKLQKFGTKLHVYEGEPKEIIERLIQKHDINAVFVNRDYTPFSITRDSTIQNVCEKNNCEFNSYNDATLNAPEITCKEDGTFYKVFTPFFKNAQKIPVQAPKEVPKGTWSKNTDTTSNLNNMVQNANQSIYAHGGRSEAIAIIKNLQDQKNYDEERNVPALDATTGLSAHLKFGTVSPREIYEAVSTVLGQDHSLIRQLYWRDFFYSVALFKPTVFGHAFTDKYDTIQWNENKNIFKAWCEGRTGFPIVDAGMRELNETGYMHNRVRMIVASFLVKDLHINWQWGEKYFAQKLVDYDPCINNGNWQWAASTGCDAQPYFRVFNPWLQQKRFDPECTYIKKWIPELISSTTKTINSLETIHVEGYPEPIIDHKEAKNYAIQLFKNR